MTPENEYEREGAGPMPVQSAEAVGLEGVDEPNQDVDPAVAAEVQLQEETRETEAEHGAEEDAVEDPAPRPKRRPTPRLATRTRAATRPRSPKRSSAAKGLKLRLQATGGRFVQSPDGRSNEGERREGAL